MILQQHWRTSSRVTGIRLSNSLSGFPLLCSPEHPAQPGRLAEACCALGSCGRLPSSSASPVALGCPGGPLIATGLSCPSCWQRCSGGGRESSWERATRSVLGAGSLCPACAHRLLSAIGEFSGCFWQVRAVTHLSSHWGTPATAVSVPLCVLPPSTSGLTLAVWAERLVSKPEEKVGRQRCRVSYRPSTAVISKLPRYSSAWAEVHVFPVREPIFLPRGVHLHAVPLRPGSVLRARPRLCPLRGSRHKGGFWGSSAVRGGGRNPKPSGAGGGGRSGELLDARSLRNRRRGSSRWEAEHCGRLPRWAMVRRWGSPRCCAGVSRGGSIRRNAPVVRLNTRLGFA